MRRMKQLLNFRLLKISDFLINSEYIYSITKKSSDILGLPYNGITKTDKILHYLACADFFYYYKKQIYEICFENQYYFNHNRKKYSFRSDILVKIDRWYLVEIDLSNKRFDSKINVWELFYSSGVYNKYFDKFPPIVIVSNNVDKIQKIVEKVKTVDLNYVFRDYDKIRDWDFRY